MLQHQCKPMLVCGFIDQFQFAIDLNVLHWHKTMRIILEISNLLANADVMSNMQIFNSVKTFPKLGQIAVNGEVSSNSIDPIGSNFATKLN